MTDHVKKLQLSSTNKQLTGVCGGIGEYLGVDPTVVRLAWIVLTVLTGIVPGIVGYIVAAVVMPTPGSKEDSQ